MCLAYDEMLLGNAYEYTSNYDSYNWTKIINQVWYVVEMQDFKVNGDSLGIPEHVWNDGIGTIVDSGTTLLLLNNQAFNAFALRLEKMCSYTSLVGVCDVSNYNNSLLNGVCFAMTEDEISAFPTVSVSLVGIADLAVPPQAYLIPSGNGTQCLGIQSLGTPNGPGAILGDVFMINYNVVFDRENSLIGFGSLSSCLGASDPKRKPLIRLWEF